RSLDVVVSSSAAQVVTGRKRGMMPTGTSVDRHAVEAFAASHGYREAACGSCSRGRSPGCATCDGTGRVWLSDSGTELSEEAIVRLIAGEHRAGVKRAGREPPRSPSAARRRARRG